MEVVELVPDQTFLVARQVVGQHVLGDVFQKLAEDASLINNPWGKPASKIFDYVPPEWIELVPKESDEGSPKR